MSVANGGDDCGAEEDRLAEGPVALVGRVFGCVNAPVASVHHQLQKFFQSVICNKNSILNIQDFNFVNQAVSYILYSQNQSCEF